MHAIRRGRRLHISLEGELDVASRCDEPDPGGIDFDGVDELVVDMRRLTFMDLEGLRYIMELRDVATAHGCRFEVVPGPRQVQRVFELTGLGESVHFLRAA